MPELEEKYIPPKIVTYTSEEIVEQIGPVLTCTPDPSRITLSTTIMNKRVPL
jgi:hypothetical protein